MFRTFLDESGADPQDPVLVTAAFVGRVADWDEFADEWQIALEADNPKPLVFYENQRYFKHSEARARENCFHGFSDEEAELKTVNLASVIKRYDVGALGLSLKREMYFRIVDEMVTRKSGRLYNVYAKDAVLLSAPSSGDSANHSICRLPERQSRLYIRWRRGVG